MFRVFFSKFFAKKYKAMFTPNYSQAPEKFDPYMEMQLNRNATLDEIRKQFRSLTLKYHPDRNRRNKNYNPKKYANICKAYSILNNPNLRKKYDSEYGATFMDLQSTSRNYNVQQSKESQLSKPSERIPNEFGIKEKFNSSDLNSFNKRFEQSKAADPNDHGYGELMKPRATLSEVQSRSTFVSDVQHPKMSFNESDFNTRFQKIAKKKKRNELMEYTEEPNPFQFGGSHFTNIAMHDGYMIVGEERQNYTKTDTDPTNLSYVDYMEGFQTITENLPDNPEYDDSADINKRFEQRMSYQSRNPYDDLPESEKRSFYENQSRLEKEKQKELQQQQQYNRRLVGKYKDQYLTNKLSGATQTRGDIKNFRINSTRKGQEPYINQSVDFSDPVDIDKETSSSQMNKRLTDRQFLL